MSLTLYVFASRIFIYFRLFRIRIISRRFSVIKRDIVNRVAEQMGITKVRAETAVDALFNAFKNALRRSERIELRGFGVFIVKPRKSGVGRNPRTGEEVAIPPGNTIRFKPGKDIRADKITPDPVD